MVANKKSLHAFFALVKAGLWEQEVRLSSFERIDFNEVYQLAQEQSVVGLVAAGLDYVVDVTVPQTVMLTFAGMALQTEQRNCAMNNFIGSLIKKLQESDICSVLVKGQGVAQCYERPLWRTAGDIDLFFDKENYNKAKEHLLPLATSVEPEDTSRLHWGLVIDSWLVELHGTMHCGISNKINRVIDKAQVDIFKGGGVRCWHNDSVDVLLPSPDNDVIIVFTHFINHFYGEGIGLRQICDWCRVLWVFRDQLNRELLYHRLQEMNLLTEWQAFGLFAVEYLGMPENAMPLYDKTKSLTLKSYRICDLIIKTGSFGKNKDDSYRINSKRLKRDTITLGRRIKEFSRLSTIFPANAPKFFINYVWNRVKASKQSGLI